MPEPGDSPRPRHLAQIAWALPWLCLALPAGADWLITLEGSMIETRGPWAVDGHTLTYVDLAGEEHVLDVDGLDLEASEETTALRAGEPYVPPEDDEAGSEAADGKRKGRKGKREKPKVILYMTSLCHECTRARELLEDLEVDFVAKDINTSPTARKEYKKKAGHGGGLPVIDVDGFLVFSNNPRVIRQRVREMLEREEKEKAAPSTGEQGPEGDSQAARGARGSKR